MGRGICRPTGMVRGVMLLACLWLTLFVAPAFGQAIKGKIVSVGIGGNNGEGGLYRPGSWVPVQVLLENRSGKDFEGRLAVEQQDLDGDHVTTLGTRFILPATEVNDRTFWAYYWPAPDDDYYGIKSVLLMDKNNTPITNITLPNKQLSAVGIPLRENETGRSDRYALLLGSRSMGWSAFQDVHGGTESVRFAEVSDARQLPDDVKGLDAVDVIIWRADELKVSDIPPDFQLKAMLEWVKAGGHLIISVGQQGQEFLKAGGALAEAMPMTLTGSRTLRMDALAPFKGLQALGPRAATVATLGAPGSAVQFVQATGTLKPGARPISCGDFAGFEKDPLAVTGLCGRGAITVLTMDAANPEMERLLGDKDWIEFWSQIAGWQVTSLVTKAEYAANTALVTLPPRDISLDNTLASDIDVKEVTEVRILVAILFLVAYWLIAGPLGHLVLKHYKVVHWSWWIFGATVLLAITAAGGVVLGLHVNSYDLRHRSFVLGTVNSPEVTVLGVYGIYAPQSGGLEISQPEGPGMNYLMPLCIPSLQQDPVKPYADPQSYDVLLEHPNQVAPVYRNTLKKLEGRWTGTHSGIDGAAAYTGNPLQELRGELVNHSGYDLENVQVIVYRPAPLIDLAHAGTVQGDSHLYTVSATWKNGDRIVLDKDLQLDRLGIAPPRRPGTVEKLLQVTGWKMGESRYNTGLNQNELLPEERDLFNRPLNDELLNFLLDLRMPDHLRDISGDAHHEPIRGIARLLDSTKALHAAGALIVANAGSIERGKFVNSPVPITVGGNLVPGKGDISFAWALPVEGHTTAASDLLGQQEDVEPGERGRGPLGGAGRGTP